MAESADLQKLSVLIEANTRSYERAMAKVQQQTERAMKRSAASTTKVNKSLRNIEASAALATTRLLAMAGVVGPGSALLLGMRAISEASDLGKIADKVGIGVEELQRLRFGFELIGVAVNQTDTAMQRFSRRIGEAANGGGELYEIIRQNEVALRNQDGSMRSQVEILRDYANLIKNAGSEQERLVLAFKAFDTEGAGLVNALKDGANGLDVLMSKADEAGGVLEEKLVRKAEEIDDEFATLSRNIELGFKRAAINSASFFGDFIRDTKKGWSDIFRIIGGQGDAVRAENKIGRAFDVAKSNMSDADIALAERIRDIYGQGGNGGSGTTIVPSGGSGGKSEAERQREREIRLIEREQQAIASFLDDLRLENELIGVGTVEREKAIAIRRLGLSATDEQISAVEQHIEANHRLQQSYDAVVSAQQLVSDAAFDALLGIADGSKSAEDALRGLIQQLSRAALQAALLGQGPLAGIFGAANPAGGVGGIVGAFLNRGMAGGGNVSGNSIVPVGERGPELFVPKTAGTIVSSDRAMMGGDNNVQVNVINESGQPVSQKRRRDGNVDIIDVLIGENAKALANGRFDGAMQRYGASPQPRQR